MRRRQTLDVHKTVPSSKRAVGAQSEVEVMKFEASKERIMAKEVGVGIKVKEGNWKGVLAHPAGLDVEMKILGRLERVQLISNLHQGLQ